MAVTVVLAAESLLASVEEVAEGAMVSAAGATVVPAAPEPVRLARLPPVHAATSASALNTPTAREAKRARGSRTVRG